MIDFLGGPYQELVVMLLKESYSTQLVKIESTELNVFSSFNYGDFSLTISNWSIPATTWGFDPKLFADIQGSATSPAHIDDDSSLLYQ
jgi:hypothetical protein